MALGQITEDITSLLKNYRHSDTDDSGKLNKNVSTACMSINQNQHKQLKWESTELNTPKNFISKINDITQQVHTYIYTLFYNYKSLRLVGYDIVFCFVCSK